MPPVPRFLPAAINSTGFFSSSFTTTTNTTTTTADRPSWPVDVQPRMQ